MQMPHTMPAQPALSDGQRRALISLLVDDDPAIYEMVRTKLLSYGPPAVQWLRPHTLSSDPRMRRRAQEIVLHQARLAAEARFLEFCQGKGEGLDLEQGTGLLAQTRYPSCNPEGYCALYDAWAAELDTRLDREASPEEQLATIASYLFDELGFAGNDEYGADPDSCFLNRVVDKRSGNPIGLSVIYLFVTRRLRLPIRGIGLPGHFVCRYQSSTKELFIDCFRRGVLMSKGDCIKYLLQSSFGFADGHLSPVSPRRILLRMCNNLVNTYAHLDQIEEASRAQKYVLALSR
jgi:regulator of sirC expression with transglutaminase-like and TPR domain